MGRTLTPERKELKQQAISLRYDYGLTERKIARQLDVDYRTIHRWLPHYSHTDLPHNNEHITHLEGDCLEILPTLPDKSVDVLMTDPPYSVMNDYECIGKIPPIIHRFA